MRAVHAVVAGAVAVLAAPGVARAETIGVLAVAPPPGPTAELAGLASRLRDDLAAVHPGVLDGRELRDRMAGLPEARASLAELERAYEGARAAYQRGDAAGSLRALSTILAEVERLPDAGDVFAFWQKVVLRLARTELDLGDEEAARAWAARLVRAAPNLAVDKALQPPRVVQLVEDARIALAAAPVAALVVRSSPPGARVFVEGREVGTAPVRVVRARDRYRVSAALGEARASVVADLSSGDQDVVVDLSVPGALRPASGPGVALADADPPRRLVEIGGYLGLDALVTVRLGADGGAGFLAAARYDVLRGALEREARVRLRDGTVPAGGTAALARFLATGDAGSELVEIPGAEQPWAPPFAWAPPPIWTPPPGETLTPDHTGPTADLKPRFPAPPPPRPEAPSRWTTLGTGVAALGFTTAAIVSTLSASASYADARRLRNGGDLTSPATLAAYDRHVASGDAAMRTATVCWVGAGLSAMATGILGYVQYTRTGEIGPFRF